MYYKILLYTFKRKRRT